MTYENDYVICDSCLHKEVCSLKENMKLYMKRLDELLPDLTKGEVAKNDEELLEKFDPFFITTEVICQYKKPDGKEVI
jgi:hypothetical protein